MMTLWMSRDTSDCDWIEFWKDEPRKDGGTYYASADDGRPWMRIHEERFKSLTGLPLPRKGSKKLVEVSISIKPKGDLK